MIHMSIKCDGCGCEAPVVRTSGNGQLQPHSVRTRLEKLGWSVGLPGGRDYCLECRCLCHQCKVQAYSKLEAEKGNAPPRTIPFP